MSKSGNYTFLTVLRGWSITLGPTGLNLTLFTRYSQDIHHYSGLFLS